MSCGLTEAGHVHHLAMTVQPILAGSHSYQPELDPVRIDAMRRWAQGHP